MLVIVIIVFSLLLFLFLLLAVLVELLTKLVNDLFVAYVTPENACAFGERSQIALLGAFISHHQIVVTDELHYSSLDDWVIPESLPLLHIFFCVHLWVAILQIMLVRKRVSLGVEDILEVGVSNRLSMVINVCPLQRIYHSFNL